MNTSRDKKPLSLIKQRPVATGVVSLLLALLGYALLLVIGATSHPALLKSPDAYSYAISDVIGYHVIEQFSLTERFYGWDQETVVLPADYRPPRLCHADELPNTSPRNLSQLCRPVAITQVDGCENKGGCAALSVHPSLMENVYTKDLIINALEAPCDVLHISSKREANQTPSGFFYSPNRARGILGCDTRQLRLDTVLINWGTTGTTRIEVPNQSTQMGIHRQVLVESERGPLNRSLSTRLHYNPRHR